MSVHHTLVTELEDAITSGSAERRANILQRVTDLFVLGSAHFSDAEIEVFDDVIIRLAAEIEVSARALLANRLAPLARAPLNITRVLACDDEIRVAYPILAQSERLDDTVLAQNAQKKGQEHLLAIAQRKSLSERVTDILIERGNRDVVLKTAMNAGAKFSDIGYSLLVKRAHGDDILTTYVGSRPDIPHHLFLVLLTKASTMVRRKLTAENPRNEREIDRAVTAISNDLRDEFSSRLPDYASARTMVQSLYASGQLTDGKIREFIEAGKSNEAIAALGQLCNVPVEVVEQAMFLDQSETVIILAKAAKLSWRTTKSLLSHRFGQRGLSPDMVDRNMASFERLTVGTAQRIVEFYKTRPATALPD